MAECSPSVKKAIITAEPEQEVSAVEKEPSAKLCSIYAAELGVILRLGWPNSVNQFLTFVPGLVMLTFLGSNADELAAAGMGFMFANVSGFSLIIGSGAGATPLISQAFGAGNYSRCGSLLQRQIAIHAVLVVFVAVVWLNTEQILVACHQPLTIAKLTGEFMRWRLVALPFFALKEDFTNFLMAQRVMVCPMVTSAIANISNIAIFPVLIARFGYLGAPLAMTLANVIQALALWQFAGRVLPYAEAWPQWSIKDSLQGWGEILRMSLPAGIMMLSEWWGWEMNLFFAGLLCDSAAEAACLPLDVFPIASNSMVVAFMPQYGFSLASSTIIGNALGQGEAAKARRTGKIAMVLAAMVTGSICCALLYFRRSWGLLFTTDLEVVELTGRVVPLVVAYVFLDALGPGALVCALRGMGLVRLPSVITFVSFYLVGIPFGLWLTFGQGLGIQGLWAGLVLGMFVMVASLMAFFFRGIDWQAAVAEAQARAQSGQKRVKAPSSGASSKVPGKKSSYERVDEEGLPAGLDGAGPEAEEGRGARPKEGAELEECGRPPEHGVAEPCAA